MTTAEPGARVYEHTMDDHILIGTEVTAVDANLRVCIGRIQAVIPALCERSRNYGHVHYRVTEKETEAFLSFCGANDPVVPLE